MAGAAKGKGKAKGKAATSATITLDTPKVKTKVTRYDAPDGTDDPAMQSAYISNTVIASLGNPAKVKITIEAA